MFYIGQKVVYITGKKLPKDSIHTILNMVQFPCGCISFDIGYTPPEKMGVYFHTSSCRHHGTRIPYVGFSGWCSKSFRPILNDSIEYAEKLLEEITIEINEENLVTK